MQIPPTFLKIQVFISFHRSVYLGTFSMEKKDKIVMFVALLQMHGNLHYFLVGCFLLAILPTIVEKKEVTNKCQNLKSFFYT